MSRANSQSGFTLTELAVVLVVVGVLLGTALQAQALVDNAKIVATVYQVEALNTATAQFRQWYNYLPGDMPSAGLRLANCPGTSGASCNPVVATPGASDKFIGNPLWSDTWGAPAITATSGTTAPTSIDAEKYLFWSHLLLANLISGVTPEGLNHAVTFSFGVTNPAAPSGGGFIVGYGDHRKAPGSPVTDPLNGLAGLLMVQVSDPTLALQTTATKLPLTPEQASRIDRKVDDGLPASGFVQAYGVTLSCFSSTVDPPLAPLTVLSYNETVNSKDCGLIYHLSY